MGLAKGGLKVLCAEASRRPFSGSVLTLGRMDVHFDRATLTAAAREFGVPVSNPGPMSPPGKVALARRGFISDREAFLSLGFSQVRSMDVSSYEEADIIFDLNQSDPPAELSGAFDVIFDGGTFEHVFHLPNAFANVHTMLRPGGRIVHVAPSSNHVDHGFYMFSPTLFWDFYSHNRWRIDTAQVFRYTADYDAPWEVSNYQPGCLWRVAFGGLDDALYGVILVATKTEEATPRGIPLQGECVASWERRAQEEQVERDRQPSLEEASSDERSPLAKGRYVHEGVSRLARNVVERLPLSPTARRRVDLLGQALGWEPPAPIKGLGLDVVARY